MSKRDEIIAISEYYRIPMRLAAARYEIMDKKELEYIVEWWLSHKEEE